MANKNPKLSNLKPFKKGEDIRRNMSGKPKGVTFQTILKKIIECDAPDMITNNDYLQAYIEANCKGRKLTHQETIVLKMIHSAEVIGDMNAIKEILNRTDGVIGDKSSLELSGSVKLGLTKIKWGDNEIDV